MLATILGFGLFGVICSVGVLLFGAAWLDPDRLDYYQSEPLPPDDEDITW